VLGKCPATELDSGPFVRNAETFILRDPSILHCIPDISKM
jgi:hypothetical protein